MTDEIPFADLIRRTPDGGITITVDHPAGSLEWQLPRLRAEQFLAALVAMIRQEPAPTMRHSARSVRDLLELPDEAGEHLDPMLVDAAIEAIEERDERITRLEISEENWRLRCETAEDDLAEVLAGDDL